MRFSCEKCGKKYATSETPAPGRAYKLRCKACGHIIVVNVTAPPGSAGMAGAVALGTVSGAALSPRQFAATEPKDEVHGGAFPEGGQDLDLRGQESMPSPAGDGAGFPADGGYVDMFADAPRDQPGPGDDPFLAAQAYDPLQPQLDSQSQPESGDPIATTPKLPVIPKPPVQKHATPMILIGIGVLGLLGILGFVLLGGAKRQRLPRAGIEPAVAEKAKQATEPAQGTSAPAPAAQPPPAPAQAAAPAQAPVQTTAAPALASTMTTRAAVQPAGAEKEKTKPSVEKGAEADRRLQEAERRHQERKAKEEEREKLARERERQKREEAEKVAAAKLPEAQSSLSQKEIQKVLAASRKAFDGCMAACRKSNEVKLDGRPVLIRLNVQTNGAVTYPTLDDVTLNGTELGACLKKAARLMVFPKFKGDTMYIEVPLVLASK